MQSILPSEDRRHKGVSLAPQFMQLWGEASLSPASSGGWSSSCSFFVGLEDLERGLVLEVSEGATVVAGWTGAE